ncbi:MAG: SEC-C metal-binding domain-containing protein, partial [Oscillospiraceae bacterium]
TVLEYDDVMNTQREVIYKQRRQVLDGDDLAASIQIMLESMISSAVHGHYGEQKHLSPAEYNAMIAPFKGIFLNPADPGLSEEELSGQDADSLTDLLTDKAKSIYAAREKMFGPELSRELERVIMLRVVDEYWMDNIDAMTELRQGIGLRAYGQNDPKVEYKREGYEMFQQMISAIQEETIRRLFTVHLKPNAEVKRERVAKVTGESGSDDGTLKKQPVKKAEKVGRNDPCPCGSGKKYKKCCGMNEE